MHTSLQKYLQATRKVLIMYLGLSCYGHITKALLKNFRSTSKKMSFLKSIDNNKAP